MSRKFGRSATPARRSYCPREREHLDLLVSVMTRSILLLPFAATLALPSLASAAEPEPDPVVVIPVMPVMPEPTVESLAIQPQAPNLGPMPTAAQIDRTNRMWRGVGIGYDFGMWGRGHLAQGLKLDIPFGWKLGQYFGLRVRGTMVYADSGPDANDIFDPVFNPGLELFGRTPVMLGVLRVYGGGGAWAGIRLEPTEDGERYGIGGGGHVGAEFMVAPRAAIQFEVGGQAPAHALGYDGGASVMAGIMVYTGRAKPRR
jgi:hypothetical protein